MSIVQISSKYLNVKCFVLRPSECCSVSISWYSSAICSGFLTAA